MQALPATDLAFTTAATTARTAPTADSPTVSELTPSTPVHLLAVRGSHSYVETFTGVRGWIKTADVAPLAEGHSNRLPITIQFR